MACALVHLGRQQAMGTRAARCPHEGPGAGSGMETRQDMRGKGSGSWHYWAGPVGGAKVFWLVLKLHSHTSVLKCALRKGRNEHVKIKCSSTTIKRVEGRA